MGADSFARPSRVTATSPSLPTWLLEPRPPPVKAPVRLKLPARLFLGIAIEAPTLDETWELSPEIGYARQPIHFDRDGVSTTYAVFGPYGVPWPASGLLLFRSNDLTERPLGVTRLNPEPVYQMPNGRICIVPGGITLRVIYSIGPDSHELAMDTRRAALWLFPLVLALVGFAVLATALLRAFGG
jgi:hypothetical protein